MMRLLTAGESHGPALTAILEGVPAGLAIDASFINAQLARRSLGFGRGARQKIERDQAEILSGIRGGETIGSPIALRVINRDFDNWKQFMAAGAIARGRELTLPRPGHADLPGVLKYNRGDARDVLERASARETAARVAAGAIARRLLEELGVSIASCVLSVGDASSSKIPSFREALRLDPELPMLNNAGRARKAIEAARKKGETVGGSIMVMAQGIVPGLGSYAQWDRRLDARLGAWLLSIPSAKGVLFGDILQSHRLEGSKAHDAIFYDSQRGFYRKSNHAGGLEGGITNGEELRATVLLKPLPTLRKPLPSVDILTKKPGLAQAERTDTCAVVPAAVIAEALLALGLCEAYLEKFGSDSMEELLRNVEGYRRQVAEF
ncbi:MAG: chorismate synthase [Acidobacteria bacterium]|nr:chorismate synthase [Acidobacteriota bacterium]